jgi:hypothetical protein
VAAIPSSEPSQGALLDATRPRSGVRGVCAVYQLSYDRQPGAGGPGRPARDGPAVDFALPWRTTTGPQEPRGVIFGESAGNEAAILAEDEDVTPRAKRPATPPGPWPGITDIPTAVGHDVARPSHRLSRVSPTPPTARRQFHRSSR